MIAPSTDREPVLDLSFPLTGLSLPADHGYLLYAALTTAEPELHHRVDYGVHPIAGLPLPGRRLQLTPRSRLVVRTPAGLLGLLVRLGGRTLLVGEDRVTLGAPQIRTLRPAPALRSRLVVIRGFTEPEPFLEAARRQLEALGCRGELELAQPQRSVRLEGRTPGRPGPVRRTLRIRDREVVGYAVVVRGLDPEGSLRLQEQGLGGRRRFGCGLMVPTR
ncbi:MAG TPA: type I-MYXAN CRISPR-associated protein Cas6/Cmx6 [Candidatus Dormibacteraeota bacterium]|nr:type I-MYXAN CRISPR-associated protein Cas6/Cmx6 [Candidatus Dormibacteraeota bacterium]